MSSKAIRRKKQNKTIPTITMTPEVYRLYRQSICQHEPETFALLGGRLDNPFHISEFRFCPPRRDRRGRYDAGPTHVNVDHEYMNWVIDNEWVPNGKYMLGVWHSHPAGCTSPSYGDRERNEGDVVFFSACLDADDSPDRIWRFFLAPITTFDKAKKDQIHGWILPMGSDRPLKARVQIPLSDIPMQTATRFLQQCTYTEIKQLFLSPSLPREMRSRLIGLLHLAGRMDVADRLVGEYRTRQTIDTTV